MQKIIVIKMGGEIINNNDQLNQLCQEILSIIQMDLKPIIVHGGGSQATNLGKALNHVPKIVKGRRVTDAKTIEIIKMSIAGKVNVDLLAMMQQVGIDAIGINGIDSGLIKVERRPPQKIFDPKTNKEIMIDYGFVGDILEINPKLINLLTQHHFVPVIAPLAMDKDGNVYNINADTVASALAISLQADQWINVTNVDGIRDSQGKYFMHLTCTQASTLISENVIKDGMIPKVESMIAAIKSGVQSTYVINGSMPGRLLGIFKNKIMGTLLSADI